MTFDIKQVLAERRAKAEAETPEGMEFMGWMYLDDIGYRVVKNALLSPSAIPVYAHKERS